MAFNGKYGPFEYFVMHMGICNVPLTFKTLMNKLFNYCIDVLMVVYIEYILIYSRTKEDNLRHLEEVLYRLEVEDIYASRNKCTFIGDETKFLGMIFSRDGI